MATQRLNLTRDQLASFLKNFEQIKQFENLFEVVDAIAPDVVNEINIQAGNAQTSANEALSSLIGLSQDVAINDATLNAKVIEALSLISNLKQSLELIALNPAQQIGTIAVQNADNVNITGGSISGLDPALPVDSGGTGQSTFTNGELLIGNTTGNSLNKATLTAGANVTITNGAGSITIAATGVSGATGSFTSADSPAKLVTVVNGIITSIV